MGIPPFAEWLVLDGILTFVLVVAAYRVGKRVGKANAEAAELAALRAKTA